MTYAQNPAVPVPPPAKKSKWPWIAGGAVAMVLLCCGGALAFGDDSGTDSATPEATTAATGAATKEPAGEKTENAPVPADTTPGLNQPARDGRFEFTVSKVKCGVAKVGDAYLNEKAQGQFCLIDVQVKNIGKEPQTFLDSVQKGFDAARVEYSVDSTAALYANEDQQVLFEEVNPGNTVKGKLVFDIPKGARLASLELRDSMFSGGVTVNLK
ncbi:DUF4352 domain-containing protein [Actinoplanes utahensis]|uniref:DUF4352 domain-containing protein n=1 Tax=Actinoplanes utahensis TaxID=1869 RepID=A0A0A6UNJ1_ACTUT|nr:DUF4352 domain-containing protein [Actinoplanes utahensis]KHD76653.1 hypothetical protein MB27_15255 [Actinoplanes utahensis]GIF33300.1 Mpr protein [Actinoplanes utahensis]